MVASSRQTSVRGDLPYKEYRHYLQTRLDSGVGGGVVSRT